MTAPDQSLREKVALKTFPTETKDVQSRYVLVHQLRDSADIQDTETRRDTGWATTSDRAELMRKAADALEGLALLSPPDAAPDEAELLSDLHILSSCDDMEVSHSEGDTNVGDVARRALDALAAARAREAGKDKRIACLEKLAGEQSLRVMQQATRAKDAERDRDALQARLDEAEGVIERLGSSEAFDIPRVIDGPLAPEMRARMDYARAFLASKETNNG